MEEKGLERFFKNAKEKKGGTPAGLPKDSPSNPPYEPKSGGRYSKDVAWDFRGTQKHIETLGSIPALQQFIESLATENGGKGYLFQESIEEINAALGLYAENPTPERLSEIPLMCGLRERSEAILKEKRG